MNWLHSSLQYIYRFIKRPCYVLLVAVLAALDLFILVIPTDALLVSAVIGKRHRWVGAAVLVAVGSALGALTLAVVVRAFGADLLPSVVPESYSVRTTLLLQHYGALALALISGSPLPQQPGVVLCTLGGMKNGTVFLAVLLGRLVKYLVIAWCAQFSPGWLARFIGSSERSALEDLPSEVRPKEIRLGG